MLYRPTNKPSLGKYHWLWTETSIVLFSEDHSNSEGDVTDRDDVDDDVWALPDLHRKLLEKSASSEGKGRFSMDLDESVEVDAASLMSVQVTEETS